MLTASVLAILAAAVYATLCAASPFGTCRKCDGIGAHITTNRRGRTKVKGPCRRCKGQGKRLRVGRRLLNHSRTVHRAGTR
ncbi:hypothetical protein LG634_37315 [Streptomyces bambusae]|uniref:hypothetical protein n=1 Tax=Streptomyces bambusae TaxID=1550616 RepID=UPI001CFF82D7|nr:hypothetical protein [Streptomyces bambusae]MCB5170438.1 hypothetical protein [Streptomyces bambusae]